MKKYLQLTMLSIALSIFAFSGCNNASASNQNEPPKKIAAVTSAEQPTQETSSEEVLSEEVLSEEVLSEEVLSEEVLSDVSSEKPLLKDTLSKKAISREKKVIRVQWIGDFQMTDSKDPISGEYKKGLYVLEKKFEELYPEIDLQYILMGWSGFQKKTEEMIASDEADIYQAPGIASLAAQGLLEPLEHFIEKDSYDLSVYMDGMIDNWKVYGADTTEPSIYGLPFICDSRFIVYDKQLFDEWGVDHLQETTTPEELIAAAKKMTGKNPVSGSDNFGLFHDGVNANDTVLNLNEYFGGTWGEVIENKEFKMNFNTPEMEKALKMLLDINKYCPEEVMSGKGGELFGTSENNIAINMQCGSAEISRIESLGLGDRYEIRRLFIDSEIGKGGLFVGSPISMAANCENKEEAWEYIKFTSSKFFMDYLWENQKSEGVPALSAALEIPGIKSSKNYVSLIESTKYLWTPRYEFKEAEPSQILQIVVEEITLGNRAVKASLKQAQEEADQNFTADEG